MPAVRETIGRLASFEALLGGVIAGQIEAAENWPEGYMTFNRRMMYTRRSTGAPRATRSIIDCIRELCGGGVFQMPADASVTLDPALRQQFETYFASPQLSALDRMKLFRLAWDLVGSRDSPAGSSGTKSSTPAHPSSSETIATCWQPWTDLHGIVDGLMNSYEVPGN